MADVERFEIARLFGHDPTLLQSLPRSEFRKRRDYWKLIKKLQNPEAESGDKPYTVEKIGVELEANATIIGED